MHRELRQSLVVGLGDIGLSYARLVKAMGAKVIGVKRRGGPCPAEVDELVLTDEIDRVLPQGHYVVQIILYGLEGTQQVVRRAVACLTGSR